MDNQAFASGPAARRSHRDVDRAGRRLEHPPQLRSASMAEDTSLTVGQRRRLPPGAERQGRVSDGVDTSMDPVQAPRGDPPGNRPLVDARPMKLTDRDQPVLAARDDVNLSHTESKSSNGPISPPIRVGAVVVRTDDELVAALRAGDEAAFAAIVDELSPALMRVALMHVPSRAVAEEVVGDTWVGVIRGIDRFEGRSALRTWIFQILLNTARTRGKREKRTLPFASLRRRAGEGRDEPAVDSDRFQGRRGEQPGAWARPPQEWEGAQAQLESDETRRVLLEAIKALPPRQRDVIALRDLQGYSADEARNALGVSETNQRVLLHRARSKVRAALEAHMEASSP